MVTVIVVGVGTLALGIGIGVIVNYLTVSRSLLQDIKEMRYRGFSSPLPMPREETQSWVSVPAVRED